jgi:hypothetical protein
MAHRKPFNADQPPRIASGIDAILEWDRLPYLRLGLRAYLRSTYDRTGHNNTADASHYLYQEHESFNVTLDVEGRGVLYFTRANRWHGSPWHYEIDGRDNVVEETSTANPLEPATDSVFEPSRAFPRHLTETWSTTHGADLCWVPMPFEQRLRIAHSRTYYGTGYYIYHLFAEAHQLPAWSAARLPDPRAAALLAGAGRPSAALPGATAHRGTLQVEASVQATVAICDDGPAMVRELTFSVAQADAVAFGRARLAVTWDDRDEPSIDAPVALFFGAGRLSSPRDDEWLVRALPVSVHFGEGNGIDRLSGRCAQQVSGQVRIRSEQA